MDVPTFIKENYKVLSYKYFTLLSALTKQQMPLEEKVRRVLMDYLLIDNNITLFRKSNIFL